jgi:ATP-dependent helicase/nuclease subunit B
MPTEFLLAPVGAGKTEQALARITHVTGQKPFARVWVLLASDRQISEFRNRLIEYVGERQVIFNVEFFTFYDLYTRILEASGQPTRQLREAARLRLLRVLASQLYDNGELAVYGRIAHKPGFIRILADFIYELKQNIITPEDFASATATQFGNRLQDVELARIYAAYQERLLKHDIVDREGEGWLALDRLTHNPDLHRDVDLVVVDGYDQFTRLQASLVAQMAERVGDTLVTLTVVPQREATVGRRFRDALTALKQAYDANGTAYAERRLTEQVEQRHPDLQHLAASIFQLDSQPRPLSGGVTFRAVPDVVTETATVLREVKRRLLPDANGQTSCRPEDVLIVLRDYERYHVHIRDLGRAYGLPLALHLGEPLTQTPPIRALMSLITLHDTSVYVTDFQTRPLLNALRSPYFQIAGLEREAVQHLDRISREFAVVGGREAWLEAVQNAALNRAADEEDVKPVKPIIDAETGDNLRAALIAFFDAATPPANATLTAYIEWLEGLIGQDPLGNPDDVDKEPGFGTLEMVKCVRRGAPRYIISRDVAALAEFKRVLQMLLGAQELLSTLESVDATLSWASFLADLRAAVERTSVESAPPRQGRVLVTTVTDARGLPHKHVFVLGLSEGLFPLRQPEDPLYLDNERQQLSDGGLPIKTAAQRAADDGLFYELISLARASLTLSRPTVKDGAPWVESHLWRAAAAAFTDASDQITAHEVRLGVIVDLNSAATPDEAATAVALHLTAPQAAEPALGAYNWLLQNAAPLWENIRQGHIIEARRLSPVPHDAHTGLIRDPALIKQLAQHLGPDHVWSASQLNDYGICPFRFFVNRVLRIEPLQEPRLGMDARQLGLLNHKILEDTYRQLARRGMTIEPGNVDEALDLLEAVATAALDAAPQQLGFRQSPVWEQEKTVLLNRLRALVRHDFTDMNDKLAKAGYPVEGRHPYDTETPFGIGQFGALLKVGDDAPPIRVTGIIDRIDRVGDDVLVLDYKTGTTAIKIQELEAGRNFQMMLYVLTAQDILDAQPDAPDRVAGGFFFHIRNRSTSGDLKTDDPTHQLIMATARETIGRYVARARSGDFTVQPSSIDKSKGPRCVKFCEFYKLCRLSITHQDKPEPAL